MNSALNRAGKFGIPPADMVFDAQVIDVFGFSDGFDYIRNQRNMNMTEILFTDLRQKADEFSDGMFRLLTA